eukprot:CAMPEP_0202889656 /NCGR_PEP_ID=MMETSP1392-20130828/255_1 /ASSEMBLY_ACC=CAM_ASM_000868 /TAXON_ID=225041 /ORGANISM="Chlamydomonas chlamydogama, Strain SAG 11-48b" /LENGTH=281 /DNA_ID=CAMNT_0049573039 /DNA_START=49 /DNA_END=894 /DNA_ORIENTATION=+
MHSLMQTSSRAPASRAAFTRSVVAPRIAPQVRIQTRARCVLPIRASATKLKDAYTQPIMDKGELQLDKFPAAPGIYAVYDKSNTLQYIGLSRKVDASVANHLQEVPDLTHEVKFATVLDASRESLTAAWKAWVEEAVESTGTVPPGNMPGETKWQSRAARPLKKEIRLTAGKGITGITIEQLIDQVVKTNKVVAFVKGTRTQPLCGFSHKLMTLLNETKADYEVVNVLDEVHNPGLREAIKTYSQWPTIPQLYVEGEFVGGADIVEQMVAKGELQAMIKAK